MCNFMSLRVVNLDNRPFYSVVKQIIKKQQREKTLTEKRAEEGGWILSEYKQGKENFHLHKDIERKCLLDEKLDCVRKISSTQLNIKTVKGSK